MIEVRVISIGTLSHHPLWQERGQLRTPHATTTLIRSGDRVVLVDPGLPPQVIAARLQERAGIAPSAVTDVFLTNFRPAHRAGIAAFEGARWWIGERERETIGVDLIARFDLEEDDEVRELLKREIALLQMTKAAPDQLAEQVDLFPLPGFTPGTCGLLIPQPTSTTLIAGDAVPTVEHLEHGQVLQNTWDLELATESFKEAVEIADWIVPGHDNLVPNPTRRPF